MEEFNDYKVLRVVTDLGTGDDDWAALQSMPTDLVELRGPGSYRGKEPLVIKIEIVLEWLDNSDNVVTTGRGNYDVQAIRKSTRRTLPAGDIVVDSATLTRQIAHRPVIISEALIGDLFTVRLTNLQEPVNATKARVLYREIL